MLGVLGAMELLGDVGGIGRFWGYSGRWGILRDTAGCWFIGMLEVLRAMEFQGDAGGCWGMLEGAGVGVFKQTHLHGSSAKYTAAHKH